MTSLRLLNVVVVSATLREAKAVRLEMGSRCR